MFTFKYYFKIKKNSRAYLFGEKKSIEHVHGNWNLKSEKVQGREVLAMEIMCVP